MFKKIINRIKFGVPEPKEVYCQNCGRNLTEEGGDVLSSGEIHCHGYKASKCPEGKSSVTYYEIAFDNYYYDAKEVQDLVSEGGLTKYSPLEKELQNSSPIKPRCFFW